MATREEEVGHRGGQNWRGSNGKGKGGLWGTVKGGRETLAENVNEGGDKKARESPLSRVKGKSLLELIPKQVKKY